MWCPSSLIIISILAATCSFALFVNLRKRCRQLEIFSRSSAAAPAGTRCQDRECCWWQDRECCWLQDRECCWLQDRECCWWQKHAPVPNGSTTPGPSNLNQQSFFTSLSTLAINAYKMAPRTTQWLQDRPWEPPRRTSCGTTVRASAEQYQHPRRA